MKNGLIGSICIEWSVPTGVDLLILRWNKIGWWGGESEGFPSARAQTSPKSNGRDVHGRSIDRGYSVSDPKGSVDIKGDFQGPRAVTPRGPELKGPTNLVREEVGPLASYTVPATVRNVGDAPRVRAPLTAGQIGARCQQNPRDPRLKCGG